MLRYAEPPRALRIGAVEVRPYTIEASETDMGSSGRLVGQTCLPVSDWKVRSIELDVRFEIRERVMKSSGRTLNGHGSRSAQTRKRLIQAAIKVMGAAGFEGASTRALVKAAKTNLSAIPYHFGGKKELYLAAAHEIADYARVRF